MNETDKKYLEREHYQRRDELTRQIEHHLAQIQDDAYEAGLERGKLNLNKTQLVLEKAIVAIDAMMIGTGTKLEQINGIEEAYDEIKNLYEELSC